MAPEKYHLIVNGPNKSGLFSLVMQVLRNLQLCERQGRCPIVIFNSNCAYWSPDKQHETLNPWEYYFEPLSTVSAATLLKTDPTTLADLSIDKVEALAARAATTCPEQLNEAGSTTVSVSHSWPELELPPGVPLQAFYTEKFHQYIRIKKAITDLADDFASANFSKCGVVGVHMRGAEKDVELSRFHKLGFLSARFYADVVEDVLESSNVDKVFLATDNLAAFKTFSRRFGARLTSRSQLLATSGNSSPHKCFGGYQAGEEVLIDALLLARCSQFIHGISNVSRAVEWIKHEQSRTNVYDRFKTSSKLIWKLQGDGVPKMWPVMRPWRKCFQALDVGYSLSRFLAYWQSKSSPRKKYED